MPLVDPDVWYRASRGHNRQFYATDDEVHEALRRASPDGGTYVVAVWSERLDDGEWAERFRVEPWFSWRSLYEPERIWSFWFPSEAGAAWLDDLQRLTRVHSPDAVAATNGWLRLDPGHVRRGTRSASSFGVVARIASRITGEERRWQAGRRMFDRAVRWLRPRLVYSTVWRSRDGEEYVDDEVRLMTEAAAAQASDLGVQVGPRVR